MKKRQPETRPEPVLGIFWLIKGALLFDSTPLIAGGKYGNHIGHPRSHIDTWTRYQQVGKAPRESEYEEFPRGMVIYNTTNAIFTLLADRCILKRPDVIAQIKKELHLPKNIDLGTDSHYRCQHCLSLPDQPEED